MNRTELISLHKQLAAEAVELMNKKNADYGADSDAFANFRMSALLKVDPSIGLMLRMQDKMARLLSFITKGKLEVDGEGWHDSIIDLINYAVLLHGLLGEKAKTQTVGSGSQ